jgi:hypothetical protein
VPRRKARQQIPSQDRDLPTGTRGLLELERFSEKDLDRWNQLSSHLDRLHNALHFGFESQRHEVRQKLIDAVRDAVPTSVSVEGWCRVVDHQFSIQPLNPVGSLFHVGGRFNVGRDIPVEVRSPWEALYLASDYETALREKFGLPRSGVTSGLRNEDLALFPSKSHSAVFLQGRVAHAFDLTDLPSLAPLCRVLSKFSMPPDVTRAMRALGISAKAIQVIRSPRTLMKAVMEPNWRQWPAQFDVPSVSQILGGVVLSAGFEGIVYPSSKSGERCLAVFPRNVFHRETYVALSCKPPPGRR